MHHNPKPCTHPTTCVARCEGTATDCDRCLSIHCTSTSLPQHKYNQSSPHAPCHALHTQLCPSTTRMVPPRRVLNYHIGLAPSAMTQAGATPPHWLHVSRLCMPERCHRAVHQTAAKAETMRHGMCTVRCVHSSAPLRMVQCKTAGHADADHAPRQVGWATTARTSTSVHIHAWHPTLTAPCTMTPGHELTPPII